MSLPEQLAVLAVSALLTVSAVAAVAVWRSPEPPAPVSAGCEAYAGTSDPAAWCWSE